MSAKKIDDNLLREIMPKYKREDGTYNYSAMAREFDVHRSTLMRTVKSINKNPKSEPVRDLKKEWKRDVKVLPRKFNTPDGHIVKGVSALVDHEGNLIQQWIKTGSEDANKAIEAIKAAFDGYKVPKLPTKPPEYVNEDLLSVYPIADQHHGMMAWGRESGEDYDINIGSKRLRDAMANVVALSPPSKEALILNLGDWTHQDNSKNMTPASGHILDVDGRYFKVITTGVELMMDCIALALQKHEKVTVKNLPGNHDPHAYVALTVGINALCKGNERITVDMEPGAFYFYEFGKTLIGAHHGNGINPERMAMSMAVREREAWGRTKHHWFLYGHIHHVQAKEVGDVLCESFQTLASKDAYSANAGYNSGQSLSSITIHRHKGEIGRHKDPI